MELKKNRKTRGKYPVFKPDDVVQGVSDVLVLHSVYIGYKLTDECLLSSSTLKSAEYTTVSESVQNSTLIPLQLLEREEVANCG